MFETNPFTGLFGKKQIIPEFANTNTNVNPHRRTGSLPRLVRGKKPNISRFTRRPKYSAKELATQTKAVADYHRVTLRREVTKAERQLAHHILMSRPAKPVFEDA